MSDEIITVNTDIIESWLYKRGLNPQILHKKAKDIMVSLILDGPQTRFDLADRMKGNEDTIFYHLNRLVKLGWVYRTYTKIPSGVPPYFLNKGRPIATFHSNITPKGEIIHEGKNTKGKGDIRTNPFYLIKNGS